MIVVGNQMFVKKIAQHVTFCLSLLVLSACDIALDPNDQGQPKAKENQQPTIDVQGQLTKRLVAGETLEFEVIVDDDDNQLALDWKLESASSELSIEVLEQNLLSSLNKKSSVTFKVLTEKKFKESEHKLNLMLMDKGGKSKTLSILFKVAPLPIHQAITKLEVVETKDALGGESLNIQSVYTLEDG